MITVVPDSFTKVEFDSATIVEVAARALAGVPELADGLDVELRIDEEQATSRCSVESVEPVVLALDGGALEDYQRPRELGEAETMISVTRLLLELVDRRTPGFGAPDVDEALTQAHKQAWDVNLYGRVARMGLRLHQPRFRYNFRNRHGFSDAADRVFDQLWAADGLTWADLTELSDRALAVVSEN